MNQATKNQVTEFVIGADVVEVSPPFDPSGLTALTGATMMFELLCAIAGGKN